MTTHAAKLNKIENLPAVQRLALVRGLTMEDLEAIAELQALLDKDKTPQSDTIAEICRIYIGAIEFYAEALPRIKNNMGIKQAVPTARCGDFDLVYDCEYHVDEFTLLDRIHKAIVAAGLDPVEELTHLADEWESKTNE